MNTGLNRVLLLNAVSKHYAENIVLNQLDLLIPAGQFEAVVGRSGGGKVPPPAGRAGNAQLGTTPLAEIQEDTRMMFRKRVATVEMMITLGTPERQVARCARRALAAVGLENRRGWPAALSGGQNSSAGKSVDSSTGFIVA